MNDMIIHVLMPNNFFCNNLGIHRVIICFTLCLCITKIEKRFCMNCIEVFLKLFRCVPNGVVNMGFFFDTL